MAIHIKSHMPENTYYQCVSLKYWCICDVEFMMHFVSSEWTVEILSKHSLIWASKFIEGLEGDRYTLHKTCNTKLYTTIPQTPAQTHKHTHHIPNPKYQK